MDANWPIVGVQIKHKMYININTIEGKIIILIT